MTELVFNGQVIESPDTSNDLYDFAEVERTEVYQVVPASRSGENAKTLEIDEHDVLEIEYENGIVDFLTEDQLIEKAESASIKGIQLKVNRSSQKVQVVMDSYVQIDTPTRGFQNIAVKFLRRIFKKKVATVIVSEIAQKLDLKNVPKERLFLTSKESLKFQKEITETDTLDKGVHLLLIHGFASYVENSFVAFNEHTDAWNELQRNYPNRILGFDHHSLIKSPLQNAIDLICFLPPNTTLDILSFSRGGLVAEIIVKAAEADLNNEEEMIFWSSADERMQGKPGKALFDALVKAVKEKKLVVRNFVRSACPAGGTTLASQRLVTYLKVVLNAIGLIPALGQNPVYIGLKSLLVAVVKQKDNADILPGIEALNQKSAYQAILNGLGAQYPIEKTPLYVVSGDVKFGPLLHSMSVILTDVFFRGKHDFIVDTVSMYQGFRRRFKKEESGISKYGFYQSFHNHAEISHFNYIKYKGSRDAILSALKQEGGDASFKWYDYGDNDELYTKLRSNDPEKPSVVVLPGIMGSHLKLKDKRIWLNFPRLVFGGMESLKANADDITADGALSLYYGKFLRHLNNSHNVLIHGFDWRKDLLQSVALLKQEVESELSKTSFAVRIVAHSMGGLLVRALYSIYPQTWEALKQRNGFRVIFLGTPFEGSYAVINLFLKRHSIFNLLHKIDILNNSSEMLDIVREYEGMLQLLPYSPKYFSNGFWEQMRLGSSDPNSFQSPDQALLTEAQKALVLLNTKSLHGNEFIYIAGYDPKGTPHRVDINTQTGTTRVMAVRQGDGVVTWQSGMLPAFQDRVWYTRIAHQELCNKRSVFTGIVDLLESANTDSDMLSKMTPVTREINYEFEVPEMSHQSFIANNERDLLEIESDESETETQITGPLIRVRIKHCNLAYANFPVVAGHFMGDDIVTSEAQVDHMLHGELKRQFDLGFYPGKIGDVLVLIHKEKYFKGAVIVGLGLNQRIMESGLETSLTRGFVELALQGNRCKCNSTQEDDIYGISPLVVGSSYGGLDVTTSLKAILRSVIKVNELLKSSAYKDSLKPYVEIEIVELYLDKAIEISKALVNLSNDHEFASFISVEPDVITGPGGLSRMTEGWSSSWWHRLQITEELDLKLPANAQIDDHVQEVSAVVRRYMKFVSLADRARAEVEIHDLDRDLIDLMLAQSCDNASNDPALSKVLFELLVPYAFKGLADDFRNINLILDDRSAQYPWELISSSGSNVAQPMAVRTGLIRQLQDADYRPGVFYPTSNSILVIGDPVCSPPFQQLDFAKKEAINIANRFKAYEDMEVELSIGEPAVKIMKKLVAREYKIMHFAGHGDFNENQPKRSGMVMSDNVFLNPTVINNLTYVPELVFINCCYLGSLGDGKKTHNWNRLAANLGTQFIRNGVKAVVAAGWAVDDSAAHDFAEQFYSALFKGDDFGTAVQKARLYCYQYHPLTNTWGAYQCYGNPHFRIIPKGNSISKNQKHFVHKDELIIALRNLAINTGSKQYRDISLVQNEINNVLERGAKWSGDGDILETIADCYFEIEDREKAHQFYVEANKLNPHDFRYKSRCNYLNLLVLHATEKTTPISQSDIEELMELADNQINIIESEGSETRSLIEIGNFYKNSLPIYNTPDKLIQHILKSGNYYYKAFIKSESKDLYGLSNFLQLFGLFSLIPVDLKNNGQLPQGYNSSIAKDYLLAGKIILESRSSGSQDFWSTLKEADLLIAELIITPKITDAESEKLFKEAILIIEETWKRGGSQRQLKVITAHYKLLLWILTNLQISDQHKTRRNHIENYLEKICNTLQSFK